MARPYDKKDQSIRELKVVMKEILNTGSLMSISDAYSDEEFMSHALSHGLVNEEGKLVDFYTKDLLADELEHVIPKGKGGKFVIANCIPVASQHNPRRGYTDEPLTKLKRVCEDLVRSTIDPEEVQNRYIEWSSESENEAIDLSEYETTFLEYQLKAAKAIDKIIEDYCNEIGQSNRTPNSTDKYAKKLRDRTLQ